ncbi:unnamed protein product, partial [Cylicostephanus goldi]
VNVRVSKYGVWISRDVDSATVDRIPLVNIVFSVAYNDGDNRFNVAMIVKARQYEPEYKCYVFQCRSMREADEFLRKIDQLFNSMVWYKSIRPVVLAASALAYGANKAALFDDGGKNERRPYDAVLTMEEKRKKAKQAIKRQMVNFCLVV